MKPIRNYKYLPDVCAYVIQRPNNEIAGWIQTLYHNYFYVDCYDKDGHIFFQSRVRTPDLTTALGNNKIDIKGCVIDGIQLYRESINIDNEDPTIHLPWEKEHYLPGLSRLKARGYSIIKVL